MMRRGATAIVALALAGACVAADGTTGASSLKLGVGARGQGLADAYSVLADGVEALYWNPAGLSSGAGRSFMLGFQPMVEGAALGQAAFGGRFGKNGFGIGFSGLDQGSLDAYDSVGNKTGDFDAMDQSLVAGLARGGDRFAAGVAAKYWRSEIDGESASAFAADIGLRFPSPISGRMRHALVVRHLGGKVSFIDQEDPLPTTAIFGTAMPAGRRVTLELDVAWERDAGAYASAGAEWSVMRSSGMNFSLRGGYTNRRSDTEDLGGVALGLGAGLRTVSFDYAWVPFGELGDSHSVTLIWRPSFEGLSLRLRRQAPDRDAESPAKGKIVPNKNGRRTLDSLDPPRRR